MSDDLSKQVAERVLSLKKRGETWKAFGDRVGLTSQKLSNWRGGGGASLDAASGVLEAHRPRLSPAWLLAGVRPQYLPEGADPDAEARKEAGEFAVRLAVIEKVAAGDVDEATMRDIVERLTTSRSEESGDAASTTETSGIGAASVDEAHPEPSPEAKKQRGTRG